MPRLSKFNSLSFLQRIDKPQFIALLLRPWTEFFHEHGVALDSLANDDATNTAIREALCRDEDLDSELLDLLEMLEDLATTSNRDRIRAAAKDRNIVLPDLPESSPGEFVIAVFLEYPAFIRWCHDTSWHRKVSTYHDHLGVRHLPVTEEQAMNAAPAIEADLASVFEDAERSRAASVFVHLDDGGNEVVFTVTHGRLFRKDGSIKRNLDRGAVAYRPQHHDVIVYDNACGVLSVNAETAPIRSEYLRLFGLHLFDDPEFFLGAFNGVYTLHRLAELVSSGFSLVHGIDKVRLVEVTVESAAHKGVTTIYQSKKDLCLLELIRSKSSEAPDLVAGKIAAAALMISYSSGGHARRVEIKPKKVAKFDRSQHGNVTRDLLQANHFFTRPALERRRVG